MNLKGLEKNVELSTVEVANNSILSLKGNNPVIFIMENSFGMAIRIWIRLGLIRMCIKLLSLIFKKIVIYDSN